MKTTAERILEQATLLIQTHGYTAFSYSDIAKQLGIKTASIHYHYPGKHTLGVSVMARYRNLHKAAMAEIDARLEDPIKKLSAFAELFNSTLGNNFLMCPCGMLSSNINDLPKPIKEEIREFYKDSEVWLSKVLKTGLKNKVFKFDTPAADCAKMIFSAFEGAMLSARTFEDKARLNKSTKQIIRMLQA